MTEDKKKADAPEAKPKAAAKKAEPKSTGYKVAEGKSVSANRRIIDAGEEIKAEDVADIEALVKGGFVVKA